MKKLSFLFGAAVIMMTSCSNDEVVDVATTQAIGFNSFMNKSTRATTAATDLIAGTTFNNFDVWAVKWNAEQAPNQVFVAQPVSLSNGAWSYNPLRYWVTGDNYRFTALAPSRATGAKVINQSVAEMPDFDEVKGGLEIEFDNSAAGAGVDLCIATNKLQDVSTGQAPVDLQFSHMLSRIKFTFQNNFDAKQSVLWIKNIKITDATAKATINTIVGETLWTAATDGTTFVIDFTPNSDQSDPQMVIDGAGATQETKHQYIIPLTGKTTYHVSFDVAMYNHDVTAANPFTLVGEWSHSVALPATEFMNNCSYNFVAKLDATNVNPQEQMTPIKFNPTITEWNDFNGADNPDFQIEHTH